MTDDKSKMLETAISQIEKDYGKGAIMRLGSRDVLVPVSVIPTGALSIDAALGVGGVPRGRVIEIYGPESGGKTTLTLHIIAEAQKMGGQAAFIDAEHALDPVYARKLGVDVDNLLVSQPDNGEQALEIAQKLIQSGAVDVIVVDSVAALVPRAELEGDMGDPQMGLQARLMSQALRKLTAIVSKSRTCLIFINQIREKIGVMFGNPETTTGGRALKFYSSIRLDIRRIQSIKEGDRVIGSRTRAKVVKNKVAAPFREAEFDILYGEGISREGDLIDLGVDKGVLEKSGTWISFGGERLGQGRDNARVFLKEHADVRGKVENLLRKKMGIPIPGGTNGASAPAEVDKAAEKAVDKAAEKPALQAAAAAGNAAAGKPRPAAK
ncbi:MAG TPA: recombinase RecA [Candidatus Acidoferrales bacterium]|nr:recombinase RecA [Candidatus Acidoferrales bacterium]